METGLVFLIKLIIAHILADFIFQTDRISHGKRGLDCRGELSIGGTSRYGYQLLHSLTHAVVSYVLLAQWENWIVPTVLFFSHLVIDGIKSRRCKETTVAFLIDQFLHLVVILLLWSLCFHQCDTLYHWFLSFWASSRQCAILAAYILILKPTSIFLSLFIKRWTPSESVEQSLPNAGQWIGYLERVLILTFILANHLEGVGFLLAAKSIFRFGNLSKAKEIKTTEYVLIGTLTSFTLTILIGFFVMAI